jgi:hypothetical protein
VPDPNSCNIGDRVKGVSRQDTDLQAQIRSTRPWPRTVLCAGDPYEQDQPNE